MNELQLAVFKVIISIFSIKDLNKNFKKNGPWKGSLKIEHGIIRYGILNYIAKFSLASDEYFVTKKSKLHLLNNNYLKNGSLRRRLKGRKSGFTFEHPVPANVIADLLYKNKNNVEKMKEILLKTDKVTILTHDENNLLRVKGFVSNMPKNWNISSGNIFERYILSGIETPKEKIKVTGVITR